MRAVLIALMVAVALPVVAGPPPIEQPEIIPRQTAIVRPFRAYADPTLPPASTGLRALSLTEVEAVAESFYRGDPRYAVVEFVARNLRASRADDQQDLVFIARQSARLGNEHYRAYNLASAVSELESALETYDRTTHTWTHPDEVGDVWLALALVELELAASGPADEAAFHEARARDAFRGLVRVQPSRSPDPHLYPPSVVQTWREAYLSHFLDDGLGLRMTRAEAERAAGLLDVDQLVWAFTMTDTDGTRLVLQVYDAVTGRFEDDATLRSEAVLPAVREALEMRLSTVVACQELVQPPPAERPDPESSAVYLETSYASATFLERPTDRLFYARGVRLSAQIMLEDTFGLYLAGAHWVANRDRDGDLLSGVDSTRGTLGVVAGGRLGRVRVFGTGGLELARVGRVRTADDFWCKVSEGEPQVFDEERQCEESDVTDFEPQGQFGLTFGLGADVRIVGPFWVRAMAGATVSIAPFEDRSAGSPAWIDTGVVYRF